MKGRKKKPREIIELEGNPGKRSLKKCGQNLRADEIKKAYQLTRAKKKKNKEIENKKERKGGIESGTPFCPAWLDIVAKREWRRIAPVLKKLGLLTVIDRTALAGYCQAYARWREAELLITKIGLLYSQKNDKKIKKAPLMREAQKYLEICKSMCVEFGMTPSSRGRMVLPSGGDKKDEFEKMLDE